MGFRDRINQRFSKMTTKQRYILVTVCCFLCCAIMYIWFGIRTDKGVRPKVKRGAPLVAVYKAERRDMMRRITLAGQTVADASIDLLPKYDGRIVEVRADLGDFVKKGDVLMVQDTENLDISILQNTAAAKKAAAEAVEAEVSYNANFVKAKADYELEARRFERNQHLFEIGAISQNALDALEQVYLAKKAEYELLANQMGTGAAAASIEAKRQAALKESYGTDALIKQRSDLIMVAPRDGIISYRRAEVGGMGRTNEKAFTLVDNSHMYVDCSLAESDAAVLEAGLNVAVNIESRGVTVPGRLIFVSPQVEENARTYKARIELDRDAMPETTLRAGLFARAYIAIVQREKAIFVPKEAVVKRNGKTHVYIVKDDLTTERRSVRVGLLNDQMEEILEGVNDGETVAVTNQDKLNDGGKIEVDTNYADPSHKELEAFEKATRQMNAAEKPKADATSKETPQDGIDEKNTPKENPADRETPQSGADEKDTPKDNPAEKETPQGGADEKDTPKENPADRETPQGGADEKDNPKDNPAEKEAPKDDGGKETETLPEPAADNANNDSPPPVQSAPEAVSDVPKKNQPAAVSDAPKE